MLQALRNTLQFELFLDLLVEFKQIKMSITPAQWIEIEERLNSQYACVNFSLDGRRITVQWRNLSAKGKVFALCPFIDDRLHPAWGYRSSPLFDPFTEKVWRKRTHRIGLKQYRAGKAMIEKAPSKKKRALIEETLAKYMEVKVFETFDFNFSTAAALIRQYKKLEGLSIIEKAL